MLRILALVPVYMDLYSASQPYLTYYLEKMTTLLHASVSLVVKWE